MMGLAYAWYRWSVKNNMIGSREELLVALMLRFGMLLYDYPKAALKELKQTGSVAEYQNQFEELSTKVTGLEESWLISFFVARLQDHLKCEVVLAQPTTYFHAVSLAKLHEQKYTKLQQPLRNSISWSYSLPHIYSSVGEIGGTIEVN